DEQLQRSEQRLRDLVSRSTEAIGSVRFDPPVPLDLEHDELRRRLHQDSMMQDGNDLMARLYGRDDAEQIIGKSIPEIFEKSTITNSGGMIRRYVENDYRLENELITIDYSDGIRRWYLYNTQSEIHDGLLVALW